MPVKFFAFTCGLRLVACVLISGWAMNAAAAVQTDAEIAAQWGLIGTWAPDCKVPPSRDHPYLSYVVAGRSLKYQRDFGDGQDTSDIKNVRLLSDGIELKLYMSGLNPPQTRIYELVRDGARVHTKYNYQVGGAYSIKDFVVVGTGSPAPWTERCR